MDKHYAPYPSLKIRTIKAYREYFRTTYGIPIGLQDSKKLADSFGEKQLEILPLKDAENLRKLAEIAYCDHLGTHESEMVVFGGQRVINVELRLVNPEVRDGKIFIPLYKINLIFEYLECSNPDVGRVPLCSEITIGFFGIMDYVSFVTKHY